MESSGTNDFLSWSRFELSASEKNVQKELKKAKEQEQVRLLISQGKTYREIATETGISKTKVGEIAKQINTFAEPEPTKTNLEDLNESMFPD